MRKGYLNSLAKSKNIKTKCEYCGKLTDNLGSRFCDECQENTVNKFRKTMLEFNEVEINHLDWILGLENLKDILKEDQDV